jgi:two-component sensor histidine kinase
LLRENSEVLRLYALAGERESLGGQSTRIGGPQVLLEPNTAQMVAVILHELATNAVKYGALAAAGSRIEVNWSHSGDGWLALCWIERGGSPVESPADQGFGHRVIERMIGQLKGKSNFDWCPEGLACEIAFRT